MQLVFKHEWDFMGRRRFFIALSLTLIVLSLLSLSMRGLNFGVDFTGGALIEVGCPVLCEKPLSLDAAEAKELTDLAAEKGTETATVWRSS